MTNNLITRREEIIWLAGLLEGEGCFNVDNSGAKRSHGRRSVLRVLVRMTDRDVIEHAASVFPTTAKVRCVVDNRKSCFSDCYVIAWNGKPAEQIMRDVLPYMGERRSAKIRECLATPNLSHTPRKVTT